ncbi:MAG: hypothetical protein ACXVQY_11275, partial [Actinomycetota bacterium]
GAPTPTQSAQAPQQQQLRTVPPALRRLGNRVVHGELKIKTQNGYATVLIDSGTVTAVDPSAHTLTLKRPDGQSVSVTATEATRVRKNGEKASFSDIASGDLVQVIQIDRGSGFVVALIRDRAPGSTSAAGQTAAPADALAGVL